MPTVLTAGPYRFRFYSSDRGEPPHIHAWRDDRMVKIQLDDLRVIETREVPPHEVKRILRIVEDNQKLLMEAWCDYFGY
ncbi:MAG: DUF4160 domain-containing protein [Alphaproteobacteria bacterium]|nr:DUF4160 domain-containing protein [Alphaproteobacteria bacterium]